MTIVGDLYYEMFDICFRMLWNIASAHWVSNSSICRDQIGHTIGSLINNLSYNIEATQIFLQFSLKAETYWSRKTAYYMWYIQKAVLFVKATIISSQTNIRLKALNGRSEWQGYLPSSPPPSPLASAANSSGVFLFLPNPPPASLSTANGSSLFLIPY